MGQKQSIVARVMVFSMKTFGHSILGHLET